MVPFLLAGMLLASDPTCAPYETVRDQLAAKYGEKPVGHGIAAGNSLLIIFASPEGKTWSAAIVRAKDRIACLIAVGVDWQPTSLAL